MKKPNVNTNGISFFVIGIVFLAISGFSSSAFIAVGIVFMVIGLSIMGNTKVKTSKQKS